MREIVFATLRLIVLLLLLLSVLFLVEGQDGAFAPIMLAAFLTAFIIHVYERNRP